MPVENTSMPVNIRPVNRPGSSQGPEGVGRRGDGGAASSAFSPRTNVSIQNAVSDMAGILSKISTQQEEGLEAMPKDLQKLVENIMRQAFSMEETLSQGIGSTMESQRFSMEQLTTLSRILNQMGNFVENGGSLDIGSDLQALFSNLKNYMTEKNGNSLEPVLLNKVAFELLDTKNLQDLPQVLQLLLSQMQMGAGQELQGQNKDDSMAFMKQLMRFFMPRPSVPEAEAGNAKPQGQPAYAQQNMTEEPANPFMQNRPQSAQQNAQPQNAQGNAQPQNAQGNAQPQNAQGNAQPQNAQGNAQPQNAQGNAQPQNAQGNAQPQNAQGNAQPQNAQGNAQPQNAQGNAQPQNVQGNAQPQNAQGNAQPQNAQGNAQPQNAQGNTQPQNAQQSAQPQSMQGEVLTQNRQEMQEQMGSRLQNQNAQAEPAAQQAKAQTPEAPMMQNTPQTMDTMKSLAQLLLKDARMTEQDTALLQNFVNGKATVLSEKQAKQLQSLLRLCQQNIPAAVQQTATQQNLEDMPRLWAFMQLCDLSFTRKMSGNQLKKAGKDLAGFILGIRHSLAGENSSVQGQKSLNFMMPLYMGENEKAYPSYIHVYDEDARDPYTGEERKETWLRLCVLTDYIGAVELTCRVYDGKQLDMRLFFSSHETAEEFREYVPEFEESMQDTGLSLNDLKVGAVGERRFL